LEHATETLSVGWVTFKKIIMVFIAAVCHRFDWEVFGTVSFFRTQQKLGPVVWIQHRKFQFVSSTASMLFRT
jgi:hypothetical protein